MLAHSGTFSDNQSIPYCMTPPSTHIAGGKEALLSCRVNNYSTTNQDPHANSPLPGPEHASYFGLPHIIEFSQWDPRDNPFFRQVTMLQTHGQYCLSEDLS